MIKDKRQSKSIRDLNRFWIIGAGRFGQIAVARIAAKKTSARITVIDQRSIDFDPNEIDIIRQDGIQWLATRLHPGAPVDIIVPAIPVHVAVQWIHFKVKKIYGIHPLEISNKWLTRLPHPMRGGVGRIYVSHADFRCPDNCPEPKAICTHTGKPRPRDLFRFLAEIDFGDVLPIVLRSHQILPGVGGIYPDDLFDALEMVRRNNTRPLMVATACRCHGVIDFFRLRKRPAAIA